MIFQELEDITLKNESDIGTLNNITIPAIQSDLADIVMKSFKEFGGVGNGFEDNTKAFVNMSDWINARGGNCKILFPQGTYNYKPTYTEDNTWRGLTELVDVKNVVIEGYGATIQQIKDNTWTANGKPYNQESPFQYRSSAEGTCKNIKIYGLTIQGDRVPYNVSTGDGATFGLAFKGVFDVLVQDVNCNGWGTDGIYLGTTYSNAYKGKGAKILNCNFDNNTRQGCSVSGFDDVFFSKTTFSNTNGGSFGHGLDLEANYPQVQKNIIIESCVFKDNQRGSFNFINTVDVIISNCVLQEPACTSAIYCDGEVNSISINNCNIKTNASIFYANGSNIKNFFFRNCTCKTTGNVSNYATIRINTGGTSTGLDNISFKNCEFIGTGGMYTKIDGDFYFIDNKMNINKQNATSGDVFGISCSVGNAYIINNTISLDASVVLASERDIYITKGVFENNTVSSNVNAICSIRNKGGGRLVKIGYNKFSTYFYYKGEHAYLNAKSSCTIVKEECLSNGVTYRVVHGGYDRTFRGSEAQVNDIVYVYNNTIGAPVIYKCTVEGSPGTWVGLDNIV